MKPFHQTLEIQILKLTMGKDLFVPTGQNVTNLTAEKEKIQVCIEQDVPKSGNGKADPSEHSKEEKPQIAINIEPLCGSYM